VSAAVKDSLLRLSSLNKSLKENSLSHRMATLATVKSSKNSIVKLSSSGDADKISEA